MPWKRRLRSLRRQHQLSRVSTAGAVVFLEEAVTAADGATIKRCPGSPRARPASCCRSRRRHRSSAGRRRTGWLAAPTPRGLPSTEAPPPIVTLVSATSRRPGPAERWEPDRHPHQGRKLRVHRAGQKPAGGSVPLSPEAQSDRHDHNLRRRERRDHRYVRAAALRPLSPATRPSGRTPPRSRTSCKAVSSPSPRRRQSSHRARAIYSKNKNVLKWWRTRCHSSGCYII
jgi:hypothetical protein